MNRRGLLISVLVLLLLLVVSLGWYQRTTFQSSGQTVATAVPQTPSSATSNSEPATIASSNPAQVSPETLAEGAVPEAQTSTPEPPAKPEAVAIKRPPQPKPPAISQKRSIPAGGFTPGAPLDIQLAMDYPANGFPVTALGVEESIPRGWTFREVTSEPKPDIAPFPGTRLHLEFAWTKIPSFPFNFTYTVDVPESEGGGTREIVGHTLFRAEGPEGRTPESITKLTRK